MPRNVKKLTPEWRQKISEGLKRTKTHRVHNEGHTKETRYKISETRINQGIAKGKRNPMYGTTMRGAENGRWKGGRYLSSQGYVVINTGPFSKRYEHVLIAEEVLGRSLKKNEIVHHINGNRVDNRHENLLICTVTYHNQLHARMSKLFAREHFGNN